MRTIGATAGIGREGVVGGRLRGKLLILRLTARGFWRGRRGGSRSAPSSFRRSWQKSNASAVVDICARLEGLPLALELAAAHVSALALSQILERLDDSFRLLVGGSRTAPTRQQTLRATLDWSYGLLSAAEQAVFQRLAVLALE